LNLALEEKIPQLAGFFASCVRHRIASAGWLQADDGLADILKNRS
jgi:hypothetical protein